MAAVGEGGRLSFIWSLTFFFVFVFVFLNSAHVIAIPLAHTKSLLPTCLTLPSRYAPTCSYKSRPLENNKRRLTLQCSASPNDDTFSLDGLGRNRRKGTSSNSNSMDGGDVAPVPVAIHHQPLYSNITIVNFAKTLPTLLLAKDLTSQTPDFYSSWTMETISADPVGRGTQLSVFIENGFTIILLRPLGSIRNILVNSFRGKRYLTASTSVAQFSLERQFDSDFIHQVQNRNITETYRNLYDFIKRKVERITRFSPPQNQIVLVNMADQNFKATKFATGFMYLELLQHYKTVHYFRYMNEKYKLYIPDPTKDPMEELVMDIAFKSPHASPAIEIEGVRLHADYIVMGDELSNAIRNFRSRDFGKSFQESAEAAEAAAFSPLASLDDIQEAVAYAVEDFVVTIIGVGMYGQGRFDELLAKLWNSEIELSLIERAFGEFIEGFSSDFGLVADFIVRKYKSAVDSKVKQMLDVSFLCAGVEEDNSSSVN